MSDAYDEMLRDLWEEVIKVIEQSFSLSGI
jgi:hypothetical protein